MEIGLCQDSAFILRLLITNGFKSIHSPYLVTGKNAAEIAMVMDIMDTYQQRDLDIFTKHYCTQPTRAEPAAEVAKLLFPYH